MKCPHCFVEIHPVESKTVIGQDCDGEWGLQTNKCPSCDKLSIHLISARHFRQNQYAVYVDEIYSEALIYPKSIGRRAPSPLVPELYKQDFLEACLTLNDSPKASAALSRRCLQHLLRNEANIKKGSLEKEIQQVIDSKQLPSYISDAIDAIRNIGNFAAHPIKCNTTGEIAEVENGEAEWNLDVLESLFDFYFVQPSILKQKRDLLNAKLETVGKPLMKSAL